MPKAVRKGATKAPPEWEGGPETGKQPSLAELRAAGVVAFEMSPLKGSLQMWTKHLNQVSGSMVLAFGKTGVKRAFMRDWATNLRKVADEMEGFLK